MTKIHKKQTNMTTSSQSIKKNSENEFYQPLAEDNIIYQEEESSSSSIGSIKIQKLMFEEDVLPKTESEFLRFFFQREIFEQNNN
jgi:hypothetical protein